MNRSALCKVLVFAAGAAIGSVITWKIVKTKYEQIAQEEIDSVKDEYASLMQKARDALKASVVNKEEEPEVEQEDDEYPDDDERDFTDHEKEMIEYYKITSKYHSQSKDEESKDETDEEPKDKNIEEGGNGDENDLGFPYINGPYVISAEDFNSSPPGYNAQPLDYFADGVLADGWGMPLDIEETIGEEALDHFGEEQDDIIYVRNERNEIDYEVTKDPRTYEEVRRMNPNPYYGRYEN